MFSKNHDNSNSKSFPFLSLVKLCIFNLGFFFNSPKFSNIIFFFRSRLQKLGIPVSFVVRLEITSFKNDSVDQVQVCAKMMHPRQTVRVGRVLDIVNSTLRTCTHGVRSRVNFAAVVSFHQASLNCRREKEGGTW